MPAFCCFANRAWREASQFGGAGWSSPVARQAHNLKVVGSNPTPATRGRNLLRSWIAIPVKPSKPLISVEVGLGPFSLLQAILKPIPLTLACRR